MGARSYEARIALLEARRAGNNHSALADAANLIRAALRDDAPPLEHQPYETRGRRKYVASADELRRAIEKRKLIPVLAIEPVRVYAGGYEDTDIEPEL